MFRYKWHVLVMLLLSMVGFSMVNAYTINVENRDPFGTLNLSTLMIKPNANSDSTIELSGNTIRIKTSEGNTGKIRVGLVCNESGTSCKDVQTLLRYGDIEWKQIPISGTLSKVLLPESTGSNVWIGKSTDLGAITEADEKLWVIGKTRLEGDLTVSGGKITVYQICDETGKCKKVSELSTGGDTTITDSEWSVTGVIVFGKNINVLQPKNLGNHVWIGNYDENNKSDYRLWVTGKTRLDGDLMVTSGNITVYQICDENDNCKKVSELYTGNGGGGGDGYWQTVGDRNQTLTTSGNFSSIRLENDLRVDKIDGKVNVYQICDTGGRNCRVVTDISTGGTNYWKINNNKLTASGTFYGLELSSANIGASYSFEIKDSEDLQHPTTTKVLIDNNGLTVTGATTLNNNLTVNGSDGKVNVYQICDTGGSNCRRVSDISTGGTNYWMINNNLVQLNGITKGLSLSTMNDNGYSFNVYNDGLQTLTKVSIKGNGLNVEKGGLIVTGNTTLNNALTVKGNANLQSGLTVTGGTTLNNDLTVEGNSTLKNITSNGTTTLKGNLNVEEWAQFYNGLSIETGDLTVSGFTHLKSGLDVYKDANMYDGLKVSLKMGSLYQPVFRVYNWYGNPTITVEGVTDLRGDTFLNGNVAITGGKLTVNTVVSARTGTIHAQNQVPKVLSQIRLLPAGTGIWGPYENIMPDHYAKLEWYEPCQPDREGVIMYYREYNSANNNKLLGKFVGCVCNYIVASNTFDCEREVIASK